MVTPPKIKISKYKYRLPESKIASHPLAKRDDSKLLVHRNGIISDRNFADLPELLPPASMLLMNDTRVIRARMLFRKTTGATIEILCLEPEQPERDIQLAMQQKGSCVWRCMVGNLKKWKGGFVFIQIPLKTNILTVYADKEERHDDTFSIKFSWTMEEFTFAEVVEMIGKVPLPPYIHRAPEEDDIQRYQTVFASQDGSVAAPTAGLHFTDDVFKRLAAKNISTAHLTLHVGAGTFKPVTAKDIRQHVMHGEQLVVDLSLLEKLRNIKQDIIAVGTTSVRTIESLYWMGVKYINTGAMPERLEQWDAYDTELKPATNEEVYDAIIGYLQQHKLEQLKFQTSLIIVPGYQFRIIDGMLTNFHQPKSTLLLLISAFLGDKWKEIYKHALRTNYRFLSYGDACLFLK